MVYNLIAFFAGVYFGIRNSRMEKWKLIEKGVPFGIAISAGLNILMFIIAKPEVNEPIVIEAVVYLFFAFLLGSIAGNIAGRRLSRAFRIEKIEKKTD